MSFTKDGSVRNARTDYLSLAENISQQTTALVKYLEENGFALSTFEAHSDEPPNTAEYASIYNDLRQSIDDLSMLVEGPKRSFRSFACQANDLAALQVAFEFRLFHLVPATGNISMQNLAFAAGLDTDRASRVIRLLATHRIFREDSPGFVSHSAISYLVCQDQEIHCAGHYTTDEMFKASVVTADCLKASPYESDSLNSPFRLYHQVPMYTYYMERPIQARRFARAMAGSAKLDRQIDDLQRNFSWRDLKGAVIDVGGGNGSTSIALAQEYSHLDFVVQDISLASIKQGEKLVPDSLKGRIKYQQHDFFSPQTIRDAGAFFIRQCTHNWDDNNVVKILRALVPGLESSRQGTPLLINDTIMPEPGVLPTHVERSIRQLDILMMIGLGAKQRSLAEFESLLLEADRRFKIKKVSTNWSMGLIETYLEI